MRSRCDFWERFDQHPQTLSAWANVHRARRPLRGHGCSGHTLPCCRENMRGLQFLAMRLMREIRLSALEPQGQMHNSWAGWPESWRIAPYITLQAVVDGQPNLETGYLCDIRQIDKALRAAAMAALPEAGGGLFERAVRDIWGVVCTQDFDGAMLAQLRLIATPFLSYTIDREGPDMIAMTQSFEFSAAHRLYCKNLSDAANVEVFGKCSNPNGHGHNYRIDVTVAATPNATTGLVVELSVFEALVKELVIDRFDHKNLNLDCPEFAELNPSVENIAQVIWDKLDGQFTPAVLNRVRVWETPKTYAEIKI